MLSPAYEAKQLNKVLHASDPRAWRLRPQDHESQVNLWTRVQNERARKSTKKRKALSADLGKHEDKVLDQVSCQSMTLQISALRIITIAAESKFFPYIKENNKWL